MNSTLKRTKIRSEYRHYYFLFNLYKLNTCLFRIQKLVSTRFSLDRFHYTSSLKQQSACRHITPLWYIIPYPSQHVFVLTPKCHVLSGEASNTIFIFLGLTWGKHSNLITLSMKRKRLDNKINCEHSDTCHETKTLYTQEDKNLSEI